MTPYAREPRTEGCRGLSGPRQRRCGHAQLNIASKISNAQRYSVGVDLSTGRIDGRESQLLHTKESSKLLVIAKAPRVRGVFPAILKLHGDHSVWRTLAWRDDDFFLSPDCHYKLYISLSKALTISLSPFHYSLHRPLPDP
jgi:hypothetical protein